jgi:uncharacterized protein YkwD
MPAEGDGMAFRARTILFVVAVAAALLAAPPMAGASVVDDLLGIVSGGGSEPPPPQQPPPQSSPQKPPPDAGGPPPLAEGIKESSSLVAPASACPGQDDPRLPEAAQVKTMVCMLSYARTQKGRPALRGYKPLHVSATHKAQDIRHCQRLSHNACGRDVWYWFTRVGFFRGTWMAGEILADGAGDEGTAQGTLRRWLGSKPHRAVIFHPKFNRVGVGTVTARFRGVRHTRIWVAHFGYRH